MSKSKIISLPRFRYIEVAEHIGEDTLVLYDLDDTTFRGGDDLCSAQQFTHMVRERVLATKCTEAQAKVEVYPRWIASQEASTTLLIDPELPVFLSNIKEKGAIVVGFTARQPVIADITAKQLAKHGVVFHDVEGLQYNTSYQRPLHLDTELQSKLGLTYHAEVLFKHNILFCHDLNHKGDVLDKFLPLIQKWRTSQAKNSFKRIVFFDDGLHNLNSVEFTCGKHGMEFLGVHVPTEYVFDAQKAAAQERSTGRPRSRSIHVPPSKDHTQQTFVQRYQAETKRRCSLGISK